MIAAYLRVSTDKQDVNNQKHIISEYALQKEISIDRWVEETVSGRVRFRKREIWDLVEDLGRGDILIVAKISRIGRNMFDLNGFFGDCLYRGITLIAVKDGFCLENTINCRIMANSLALVADVEVENIRQNTKSALAAKKAEGKILGRPKGVSKLEPNREEIMELESEGVSKTEIACKYNVSRTTVHKFLKG